MLVVFAPVKDVISRFVELEHVVRNDTADDLEPKITNAIVQATSKTKSVIKNGIRMKSVVTKLIHDPKLCPTTVVHLLVSQY